MVMEGSLRCKVFRWEVYKVNMELGYYERYVRDRWGSGDFVDDFK